MELEVINKLFLELSQVATAKTKRELELEEETIKNGSIVSIGRLFLYDNEKGWGAIASDLKSGHLEGFSEFIVRFEDGTEHCVIFKTSEL
jgi:hypothetical protein